jgi:hypothetical protein
MKGNPMKPDNFEIQLPFSGLYCSIHSNEAEREVNSVAEYWADLMGSDMPESLADLFLDAADYSTFNSEYAKAYSGAFLDEYLDGDGQFSAMSSPRFYNFETDRVFVTVGRGAIAKMLRKVDRERLTQVAKDRHTSRSGFASHYDPDWRTWGRVIGWDHNELQTLLLAYLETESWQDWDQCTEYALMEHAQCNGKYHQWLWNGPKADRAWKLFNYLTETRKGHPKDMAEWRVKYAKPWADTPLGASIH